MEKANIDYSQKKLILGLIICIIFIAAGITLLIVTLSDMGYYTSQNGQSHQLDVVTTVAYLLWIIKNVFFLIEILFFILCGLAVIKRLKDTTPFLVIDKEGILQPWRKNRATRIKWSEVKDIVLNKKRVVLLLKNNAMVLKSQPKWAKSFLQTHKDVFEYPISFFLSHISAAEGYTILLTFCNESKSLMSQEGTAS